MPKTKMLVTEIRRDASDALEVLLRYFDGERPAPFDKVIQKLMAIETTAIQLQK